MKALRRIVSALCAACLAVPATALQDIRTDAATTIRVSPDAVYAVNDGVFEGWGTSLCWWANRIGYSDSLAQQAADAFYGSDGLRLNIARFNIGGGDDPTHDHITRTDSNMPGYTVYKNGSVTYDWSADASQRNVLMRAIEAAGEDMIVEMFSNSPPYYMTNSGCSSGATDGGKNNLKDDCYDDFAEYLAEVCYHYEHDWGVDIQSVTAMNEPYTNYWYAGSNKQEGCHFDLGNSQTTIILELQKAMAAKGLGDVMISGTDETSIDTQIDAFNKLSPDARNAVSRIDTHTYSGSKRSQLKDVAVANGKNLWMSEVDGGGTAGTDAGEMGAALWLAERIALDLNGLNASAWIMWQVIDNHISQAGYNGKKDSGMVNLNGGYWGTAVADHDKDTIILTKKYYAFGQYTRYIRPGMIMLNTGSNTVAAYDPASGQVVIVAYNTGSGANDMRFDLSDFNEVGTSAQIIRTSASENWKELGSTPLSGTTLEASLPAHSVTTFVIDGCSGNAGNFLTLEESQLSGSDSWKNNEATDYRKAFDGKTDTYFDGVTAGWVQADLGAVYDLSSIAYCPRKGYEYRMVDGYFELSTDGKTWHTVHTITEKPGFSMHSVRIPKGEGKARYVRYAVPEGAPKNAYNADDSYCCNIAEIRLSGTLSPADNFDRLEPAATSGSDSWKNNEATDYRKVFDGNPATYFDGVGAGWVQADLGEVYDLYAIGYCPRDGYEYRMIDGIFEVSTDGTEWQTIYTVGSQPSFAMQHRLLNESTPARYVRYRVPDGAPTNGLNKDNVYCCNIAEIELYGLRPTDKPKTGDVDQDGKTGLTDVVMLQKYILGAGTLPDAAAADVYADGVIDVFDLAMLKRLVMNGAIG